MKILIIGTGYVGLVTGACFAYMGHQVTCLDIDAKKIALLNEGIIPIYETGLAALVTQCLHNKSLHFTTNYDQAVRDCFIAFITVPTPSLETGLADLSQILAATQSFLSAMNSDKYLVIKSTVPPGTYQQLSSLIEHHPSAFSCHLISNPEFLREGSAIEDCLHPDRIIIGCNHDTIRPVIEELYTSFLTQEHQKLIFMDPTSAEMTKYAANAMLATRISFMNELAGLCEKLDANIESVRIGIGSDKRIGPQFLHAGIGFGGSCFPKDIKALQACANHVGYTTPILTAIDEVNKRQKKLLGEKLRLHFNKEGGVRGKTIAIWGLSFKPNTDDIREAPALELVYELKTLGAKLRLFDPVAMDNTRKIFQNDPSIHWSSDLYEASIGADAIALLTEWEIFRLANLAQVLNLMKGNAFFDGRNQYDPLTMQEMGFNYFGIGIPHHEACPV